MKINSSTAAVILRILLGWFMFFAGLEKVVNPDWTASGFLMSAKTFPEFYAWFATASNAWWVDPINAWGIFLIGVALLLGVFIRPAALFGAMLMVLYYFPHVAFPYVDHGFIVEEHLIYASAFLLVALLPAARHFGLGNRLRHSTFLGKIPYVRQLI